MKTSLLAAAALALVMSTAAGHATTAQWINQVCGAGCADPMGEERDARANWQTLERLGTTQWVGAQMGGTTLDAGALLAGARVAGPLELDAWLRGGSVDPVLANRMQSAMLASTGIDVTSITGGSVGPGGVRSGATGGRPPALATAMSTGQVGTNLGSALDSDLAAVGRFMGPGGGGTSGYCDNGIASAQNASAQRYIQTMQDISVSGELGFSQLGGSPIGSGQRSSAGIFGGSCLDRLMQGNRDLLFRPPQLSQLVSMLSSMFGPGGGGMGGGGFGAGACNNMPSVLTQVLQSMPSGIFQGSAQGGFFPYLQYGAGEGPASTLTASNAFGLLQGAGSTTGVPRGGIADLFGR